MHITTTKTSALGFARKTPILEEGRTSIRPPTEEWVIEDTSYSSAQLAAMAPEALHGKTADYVFRTSSLKKSATVVGVSAAVGAGVGAVAAPLLSSFGRLAQSAASTLMWPHVPAPTGAAGLVQTVVSGALLGAATFGTFHAGLMGGFQIADVVSPTSVQGELQAQDGRLTFKIPEAKHSVDLQLHAAAEQATWGDSNQWWEEVEADVTGQSAGYPGHLDF